MTTAEMTTRPDCCEASAAVGLDAAAAAAVAATFKALADPARVRLLSIVAGHPDGEVCVCDLTAPLGLSQPTVSHHMAVLGRAGLVRREQRGKWAYFSLAPDASPLIGDAVRAVVATPTAGVA